MFERIIEILPDWLHPRFPLVANELRVFRQVDAIIESFGKRFLATLRPLFIVLVLGIWGWFFAGPLFGYLLFPVTVIVVPTLLVISELLFLRVLVSLPGLTAQMIAGEMERGTWDALLSTPLPRHQIILSKFGALFWNFAHALWPLVVTRVVALSYVLVEGIALESDVIASSAIAVVLLSCIIFIVQPQAELLVVSSIGLVISFATGSVQRATTITWTLWLLYRMGLSVLFTLLLHGRLRLESLTDLGLNMIIPHSAVLLSWLLSAAGHVTTLAAAMLLAFMVVPLLIGTISLALMAGMMQYQGVQ